MPRLASIGAVTALILCGILCPRTSRGQNVVVPPKPVSGPALHKMYLSQVQIPSGIVATMQQGPDFSLHYFNAGRQKNAKQILFAYNGNHPSFPSEDTPKKLTEGRDTLNSFPARVFRWRGKDGKQNKEMLVALKVRYSPQMPLMLLYLHFAYSDLTDAQAAIAENIIASVRKAEPEMPASSFKPPKKKLSGSAVR